MKNYVISMATILLLVLSGCTGHNSSSTSTSYTVGGTTSGLSGTVVVQNNANDNLSITTNGTYTFSTPLNDNASYNITILTQPNSQTCTVSNATGTINGSNVTNANITCTDNSYTVGGTISGLSGQITLQNNNTDDLNISSNGTFTFATPLIDGSSYSVSISALPSGQTCNISNAAGTINAANVTDVNVTCSSSSSTAQLGILSGATFKMYQIENDGNKTLLYTDTTTVGDLSTGGHFDSHKSELSDNIYYLYEISGGNDIDANDDGILDTVPTDNNGTIHLFAKGADIKAKNSIRVTMASDIIYKKFKLRLSQNPYGISQNEIESSIRKVLAEDIDGDGNITITDILAFNPVIHKNKMTSTYRAKFNSIVDAIHQDDRFYYFGGSYIKQRLGISTTQYDNMVFSPDGKFAYATGSQNSIRKLFIIDINDTSNIYLRSSYDVNSTDIALSPDGNTAYVSDSRLGIIVLDVSDPDNPAYLKSRENFANGLDKIAISKDGSKIYTLSKTDNTLYTLNSSSLAQLDSFGETYFYLCGDMQISHDGTKLISNGYYLYIFDINTSTTPYLLKSYHTNGYRFTISNDDNTLYLPNLYQNDFSIADISDINNSNMTFLSISDIDTPYSAKVTSDDKLLFISSNSRGLFAFDINDKSNPKTVDSLINSTFPANIYISPDNTTLFALRGDFESIDINDIGNNAIIGRYSRNPYSKAIILSGDNKKAYVNDGSIFRIIDISTDNNITDSSIIGSLQTSASINAIVLNSLETRAFIAANDKGLTIINISNPSSPSLVNSIDTNGTTYGLSISSDEHYAFLADGFRGIKIIDISDENNLTLISSLDTAGTAYDTKLSKDEKTLFVASRENGLQIINISDINNPSLTATYQGDSFYAQTLTLSSNGNTLFIGGGGTSSNDGLEIVDVSTPNTPVQMGLVKTYDTQNMILSPDEKRLYIADGATSSGNMKIIDISDFGNAHIVGSFIKEWYDHTGLGIALSNDGNKAYLADHNAGIFIIDISE